MGCLYLYFIYCKNYRQELATISVCWIFIWAVVSLLCLKTVSKPCYTFSLLSQCYRFSQVDIRELCEKFRSASKNYQNGRTLWVNTCPPSRSSRFKGAGHNFPRRTLWVYFGVAGAPAGENKGGQVRDHVFACLGYGWTY